MEFGPVSGWGVLAPVAAFHLGAICLSTIGGRRKIHDEIRGLERDIEHWKE